MLTGLNMDLVASVKQAAKFYKGKYGSEVFLTLCLKGTLFCSGMRSFALPLCCLSQTDSVVFGWGGFSPQH